MFRYLTDARHKGFEATSKQTMEKLFLLLTAPLLATIPSGGWLTSYSRIFNAIYTTHK